MRGTIDDDVTRKVADGDAVVSVAGSVDESALCRSDVAEVLVGVSDVNRRSAVDGSPDVPGVLKYLLVDGNKGGKRGGEPKPWSALFDLSGVPPLEVLASLRQVLRLRRLILHPETSLVLRWARGGASERT